MTVVSNSTGNQIKEQIGIGFIGKRIPVSKNICYLGLATVWNDMSAIVSVHRTKTRKKEILVIKDKIISILHNSVRERKKLSTVWSRVVENGAVCWSTRRREDDTGFILESWKDKESGRKDKERDSRAPRVPATGVSVTSEDCDKCLEGSVATWSSDLRAPTLAVSSCQRHRQQRGRRLRGDTLRGGSWHTRSFECRRVWSRSHGAH